MRLLFYAFLVMCGVILGVSGHIVWQMQPRVISGPARITDGDTIRIGRHRIRLVGINTPELPGNCRRFNVARGCVEKAASALHHEINGKIVSCVQVGRDRFARILAVCHVGDMEINAWLLQNCLAHLPRNKRHHVDRYVALAANRDC